MHELRHSAADGLWRKTGDIMDAKQLLRHRSVGTTEAYLHPSMDDLISKRRFGAWGMTVRRNEVASSREFDLAQEERSHGST
jgi:integrase